MKACCLTSHGVPGKFEIQNLPSKSLGPDEVLVRVRACGVNHLDVWLEKGELPIPLDLPRVPGSEIAGDVLAAGDQVHEWLIGDRVAVQSNLFCGKCEFCLQGEESLCLKGELLGIDRDGGFAEEVVVPARVLVRLPDEVEYESSAALTLAGSTAMHMLTNRVKVRAGSWALVVAAGSGVSTSAIQILVESGASVVALGSSEAKRELALKLGARYALNSSKPGWAAEVRKVTNKRGVDLVLEHVGGKTLEEAFHCLARGGVIVTCGATSGSKVQLDLWPFFVKQQQIVGSYGRTRRDLTETLRWAAEGRLKPVIDRVLPLEETAEAIAALRDRSVLGKIVIRP